MVVDFPARPPEVKEVKNDSSIFKEVDERISYDQVKEAWLFETNTDGVDVEYEYDFKLNKWRKSQTENANDVSNSTIAGSKRIAQDDDTEEEENKISIKRLKKEKLEQLKEEIKRLKDEKNKINSINGVNGKSLKNSGVYVSNLPSDVTKEELIEVFSKYGLISEDYKTGEPRVKLYYEDEKFKGEALIVYHSIESVSLAIQMLDDSYLRPTTDMSSIKIRVQQAEFTNKGNTSEKKTLSSEEKQLLLKRKEQMKKKLSSWDGDKKDDEVEDKFSQIKRKIFEKIVVIRQVFRKEEFSENPLLEMDLKEDIQEECDKIGIGKDVTKIILYDLSECIMVKFNKPTSSSKCVEAFDGRYFDGLKLQVQLYKGEKLEKSKQTEENEEDRLNNFGNWLEKT